MACLPLPFRRLQISCVTNALFMLCRFVTSTIPVQYSRDAYYVQDRELNQRLTDMGVVASEQECSIAFALGSIRQRLRVGAILSTDSIIWLDPQPTLSEEGRTLKGIGERGDRYRYRSYACALYRRRKQMRRLFEKRRILDVANHKVFWAGFPLSVASSITSNTVRCHEELDGKVDLKRELRRPGLHRHRRI